MQMAEFTISLMLLSFAINCVNIENCVNGIVTILSKLRKSKSKEETQKENEKYQQGFKKKIYPKEEWKRIKLRLSSYFFIIFQITD